MTSGHRWGTLGGRPGAVQFNVISRPAVIKREDVTGKSKEALSETKKLQLEFWREFREKLLKSKVVTSAVSQKFLPYTSSLKQLHVTYI